MSSSHIKNNKGGNGKTRSEPAQQIKDLQNKIDFLTGELRRKDEQLEDLKSRKDDGFIVSDVLWVSEAWFNEVFDNLSDSFMIIDSKWRLVYVNEAVVKVAEKSKEHLIGQAIVELWPQFTGSIQYEMASKIMDDRTPRTWISRSIVGDIWHEYRAFPWENGIAFFARDITERKQSEEALRESESKARMRVVELTTLIESAIDGIAIYDTNGKIVRYNDKVIKYFAFADVDTNEIYQKRMSRNSWLLPDGTCLTADYAPVNRALHGETVRDFVVYVNRGSGRLWLSLSAAPLLADNGEIFGAVLSFNDITERKLAEQNLQEKNEELGAQAEELEAQTEELRVNNEELENQIKERIRAEMALRKSEENARQRAEELEKLMDVVPAAIWVSQDQYCDVITGNRAANRFYEAGEDENVSAGPVTGGEQDLTRRFFRDGRELPPDELTMQEAVAKGVNILNSELEVLLPSGRWMTILGNASPLKDSNGNVRGCIGAFIDITERKMAEDAVRTNLQRVHTILSGLSAAILLVTNEDRIEFANQEFCDYFCLNDKTSELMGLSASEMIAKIKDAYLNPDEAVARIMEIVRQDKPVRGEEVALKERTCLRDYIPIRMDGKIHGRLWLHLDITKRKRAEEALRKSEEQFRKLFMSVNEGFYIADILYDDNGRPFDYRYVEVNPEFEKMIGLSRDQIIGKRFRELVPNYSSEWMGIFNRVVRTGIPVKQVFYSEAFDRHFETVAYKTNEDRLAVLLSDITERKRAEDALAFQAQLLSEVHDAVFSSDSNFTITYWNKAAERMFGWTKEEVLGKNSGELLKPKVEGSTRDKERSNLWSKGHWEGKVQYLRKDGTYFFAEVNTTLLKSANGKAIGNVIVARDITERKRVEEALRESKARAELRSAEMDAALSSIAAGVMIYDSSGKLVRMSDTALRMIGMTAADIDMDSYDLRRVAIGISKPDGTPLKKEESPYYRALHGEFIPGEEVMFKLKDREPVWVSTAASPIRSSDGEMMGAIAVFTDITEGKIAEEEIKAAKAQAELYLDLMGHDISNMHQVAMGQLELAQDVIDTEGKLDAANREMIETSLQSLWRSAKLIDNVRKLQKIRSKDINCSAISLDEVLAGSIKQYDELYPDKSIKADYGEGAHIVYANELLRDVFTNLIGNAIKHSNGSKVDISVKLENIKDNGRKFFKISIEDDGPGIPDNMKDRIFNRLQRGESKARGMGLGLYLVKSLVDSYNGKVWVEDRIQGDHTKGSRFVVMLPASED